MIEGMCPYISQLCCTDIFEDPALKQLLETLLPSLPEKRALPLCDLQTSPQ